VYLKNRKGKVIAKAKREDFRNCMQDAGKAQDKMWRIARWATQRAKGASQQVSIPVLRHEAHEAHDPRSKAELLKMIYFPPPVEADVSDTHNYTYPERVEMPSKLTEKEVENAVRKMAKNKAPGPDGIPNEITQRVARVSIATLRRIFQACLDLGTHPKQWKRAVTIMLKKTGKSDYSNPSAYRPIALLNSLGKALETIIAKRMRYLAEKHALLPDTQMGARTGRSAETALNLFTEQVYTIWAGSKPRVASALSLDVASAFNNVSYERLIHNLRKRKIPELLIRWTEDFLRERTTELRLGDYTLKSSNVNAGIPQGSPLSPILYLFYNADLLESCENSSLRTSPLGFVDDINILTYGNSTEENCRVLERTHGACESWAKSHGSKFNTGKYELIHFTRTPKRFNMEAKVKIAGQEIEPAADIRILGVRLDTALKWGAQLKAIEKQSTRTLNALKSITGSTWGMSVGPARQVYTAMARSAVTYGANTWYTPAGLPGARKGVAKKLQAIQGKCLRVATGAYRATSTEALEVETNVEPIDIFLETQVAKTMLRLCEKPAGSVVQRLTRKIRQQMRSKGGREARTRKTPDHKKRAWLQETLGGTQIERIENEAKAPWEESRPHRGETAGEPRARTRAARTQPREQPQPQPQEQQQQEQSRKRKQLEEEGEKKWKERWKDSTKGRHLHKIAPEPSPANRKLHAGRTKPHSALLTQLRTGKIGFREFLYERGVPDIYSKRCDCGREAMSVRHVLLTCPKWRDVRETELREFGEDLREILGTKEGATAAIRMILKTGLLEQFKATPCEEREESTRHPNRQPQRG
jgi:hypothetical protein